MSQVRLNLQPPPNVDFVTGYPGIPPGPDRAQASVKGAIEVRVPASGVKAKWVRIELRKVETLPGGGPSNTFHDYVGPSPVNLWSTSDEYGDLRSQDFPFSIRIPESIPPTISLDNRAGIEYELLASVCTKGKKGFLRKAKSVVVAVTSQVIIDKHELHSTWPVYTQPETRHLAQDGVNLIVERNRTCFGPGDRISVAATVKSDSLNTVILRGFEILLKETMVFRPGISPGRKTAPSVKQDAIAEHKVAVNATLYGGNQHTSELNCMIPPKHTTPTLNAARHIDVTYTLVVKALMGTGTHLIMELPVVLSNWPREVSFEAISRIGPAPGLSLLPPNSATLSNQNQNRRPADAVAATLPINRANLDNFAGGHARNGSVTNAYNTVPVAQPKPIVDDYSSGYGGRANGGGLADEFGAVRNANTAAASSLATGSRTGTPAASGSRRPGSAGGTNRFTITNAQPQEIPNDLPRGAARPNVGGSSGGGGGSGGQWPTAEEEKKLYEQARANVAKVQGVAASPPPASVSVAASPSVASSPPRAAAPASSSSAPKQWPTAEEEKLRLFNQAQAAVARVQGVVPGPVIVAASSGTSSMAHTRQNSDPKQGGSGGSKPSGAELYAQAIQSRAASASAQAQAGGSSSLSSPPKPAAAVPYLTAEQEKAALRRYEEAKRAVDKTQGATFGPGDSSAGGSNSSSAPIAYDSLFPAAAAKPSGVSSAPPPDAPPPFETPAGGTNIMAHLSEKERLRRQYEERDNAALARQNQQNQPPPPAAYTSPPPPPAAQAAISPPPPSQYANALEEKEALRRKFEARDRGNAVAPTPAPVAPPPAFDASTTNGAPSPSRSPVPAAPGSRPTPVPPAAGRVLTAAEEKAMLRAKFEARDSGRKATPPAPPATNGYHGTNGVASPATPPPLMPRPPVDYIRETQEEDARLSRMNGDLEPPRLNGSASSSSLRGNGPPPSGAAGGQGLNMEPFTPFRAGFEGRMSPPPPPPLPGVSKGE